MNNDSKNCRGMNRKGEPCRAPATETGFCFVHSNPGRAAEIGRQGGRGNRHFVASALPPLPSLDTCEGVRQAIELIITEAYAGNQNAKRMLSFGPLLATLGKVIKTAELEERLKKVEAIAAAQQHKGVEHALKGDQAVDNSDVGAGEDEEC